MAENQPANKNRVRRELSNFGARLRHAILSEGRAPRGSDFKDPGRKGSWNSPLRDFEALALELFALQFEKNSAYRTICRARDISPENIEHWSQIPAVPAAVFKELELTSIPPGERAVIFQSSGTTGQRPSRHFHHAESLAIYEASLSAWFFENVLPELRIANDDLRAHPTPMMFLTPSPAEAPRSSLVYMFETIRRRVGGSVEDSFFGRVAPNGTWTLDSEAVLTALSHRASHPAPRALCLFGTAFSFVHLLDFLVEQNVSVHLPPGSCVMETGGYKNQSRSMPKSELHALITHWLGVPPENIICEYGMSELSSQAYSLGAPASRRQGSALLPEKDAGETLALPGGAAHFSFPPWARVQIVSPENGCEVAEGGIGLIRVFDLANVFSVMAIQTEDLGIRRGDGFELIGRAKLAEPRGCSLMSA